MTVKELKKEIRSLPDNAVIEVWNDEDCEYYQALRVELISDVTEEQRYEIVCERFITTTTSATIDFINSVTKEIAERAGERMKNAILLGIKKEEGE